MRYSDSGVVMSRSAPPRWMRRRSRALVSPVRTATSIGAAATPAAAAAARRPASGVMRLRSTSMARALTGDTYTTRVPRPGRRGAEAPAAGGGAGANISRSSTARNAASVLPLPVGASSSRCSPPAMAGQAWRCAAVGPGNVAANQARVGADSTASAAVAPGSSARGTSIAAKCTATGAGAGGTLPA